MYAGVFLRGLLVRESGAAMYEAGMGNGKG